MSAFEYAGYNGAGRRCRGIIDARDAKETRELLAAQGILADQVREVKDIRSKSGKRGRFAERIRFYEELSALLSAGIPMVDALGILLQAPGSGISPLLIAQVRDAIRDGKTFPSSLDSDFGKLPPFEKALLEAGHRAGSLPLMLQRLAGFMGTQRDLAENVRSALIYPSFVAGFALAMVLGIIGFGLPAVGRVLGETGVPLPLLIRWATRWGRWAALASLLSITAVIVILRAGMVRAAHSRAWRKRLEKALFKAPLLGAGYTLLVSLRFTRTFEMLLGGGHPLVESLLLSGTASGSTWVEDTIANASEQLRHGGCTPSEAVAQSPPLTAAAIPAWMHSGEAAGALAKMMERLAERLEKRWEQFTERALNLLLPVVIIVLGAFVLAATLSMLLPILNLNQMLLQ